MKLFYVKAFTSIPLLMPTIASAIENSTENATQQSTGDLAGLLENANVPVLCIIIGAALIIFTFFSHKTRENGSNTQEYNEKSYYKPNKTNDNDNK